MHLLRKRPTDKLSREVSDRTAELTYVSDGEDISVDRFSQVDIEDADFDEFSFSSDLESSDEEDSDCSESDDEDDGDYEYYKPITNVTIEFNPQAIEEQGRRRREYSVDDIRDGDSVKLLRKRAEVPRRPHVVREEASLGSDDDYTIEYLPLKN